MARRTLGENVSFDDVADYLTYVAVALELGAEDGDKEVAGLGGPIDKLLARWAELDGVRRAQKRAQIRSNALCKRRNVQIDQEMTELHKDTLAEVRQDRKAPLFTHLFPKPLSALTKPAVEGQVPIARGLSDRLSDPQTPAALKKGHQKPLQAAITAGELAVRGRETVAAQGAGISARVKALREDANAALLSIEGALKQIAAKRRLGSDLVDSFFPEAPSVSKKKPAPAPAPTP